MKRPLAVSGFSFLAALTAALYIGTEYLPWLIVLLAVLCAVSLLAGSIRRGKTVPAVMLSALCALLILGGYTSIAVKPTDAVKGKTAHITGYICEQPYYHNGSVCYQLMASEITAEDGTTVSNARLRLYSYEVLSAEPYDVIEADAAFSPDTSLYLLSKGIKLSGRLVRSRGITVTRPDSYPLHYYILKLRSRIEDTISSQLPQDKALLVTSLITGSKSELPDELKDTLRSSGTAHITAVSGFHVSVVTAFFFALMLFLLRGRRRPAALASIGFVLLYMTVAGFSPSVSRAGIMHILMLLGSAFLRSYDPLNSLGLSVLIIAVINPYSAADVGLLLSFSASLGIILLSPRIRTALCTRLSPVRNAVKPSDRLLNVLKRLGTVLVNIFSVSVSSFLFTIPVMVFCFRQIAIYSVFANMLISPMLTVLIVCVIIMVLLEMSVVFSFLSLPFVLIAGFLADAVAGTAGFVSSLPVSLMDVSWFVFPVWVIISVTGAAVLYALRSKHRAVRIYALAVSFTFVLAALLNGLMDMETIRIYIPSVGNGISLIAIDGSEATVLACGGSYEGWYSVRSSLDTGGAERIGYMLLSGGRHTDEYALSLAQNYSIGEAEVYDEEDHPEKLHTGLKGSEGLMLRSSENGCRNKTVLSFGEVVCGKENDAPYILAVMNGTEILICTDGTDCSCLPEEYKSCDIMVINGSVKNRQEVSCKRLIVSGELYENGLLQEEGADEVYSTLDGGVIIKPGNNGCSIRREDNWLS